MEPSVFRSTIYNTLLSLATENGINASGKNDVYGCLFGRDSAITILKIRKAISRTKHAPLYDTDQLLSICYKGLLALTSLQGNETNIESGEEPGKFIHEYRPDHYERLLTLESKPWYIYPDGILRNYDSIDSTPLCLIALYKYWEFTKDSAFLLQVLPAVEKGLNWIITYGDKDKDYLLEYELPKERKHGGLLVQSWTDSHESLRDKEGRFPSYPIAPVEVQGYAWLALRLWAEYFLSNSQNYAQTQAFGKKLLSHAAQMKVNFEKAFMIRDEGLTYFAQVLDGYKNQIKTITGNPLLLFWAAYRKEEYTETILNESVYEDVITRAFMSDMFDQSAGIRTMSTKSPTYRSGQDSYHNGSFWPKLNGMIHEGLENIRFDDKADLLKQATLGPLLHFGTPIELYIKCDDGSFAPYCNGLGQESCREQAWSAAVALDLLSI